MVLIIFKNRQPQNKLSTWSVCGAKYQKRGVRLPALPWGAAMADTSGQGQGGSHRSDLREVSTRARHHHGGQDTPGSSLEVLPIVSNVGSGASEKGMWGRCAGGPWGLCRGRVLDPGHQCLAKVLTRNTCFCPDAPTQRSPCNWKGAGAVTEHEATACVQYFC